MEVINPANGRVILSMDSDSPASINKKFNKLRTAQKDWSHIDLNHRIAILRKFADLTRLHIDKLSKDMSAEVGKPVHQARSEIEANVARIEFFTENVASVLASQVVVNEPNLREEITFEPLGVVANISAWNFPFFVSTNVIVPALLTGNAVLFKPSEFASITGQNMVELLYEAGLPSEVLQLVIGAGEVGSEIIRQDIDGLYFTGSHATGQKIAGSLAGRMCRLQLELGGKDPCYVSEDNDPELVAPMVGDGCFYNAGQSCCAIERLYVHTDIFDEFTQELTKFAESLKLGDPSDPKTYLGPLTRIAQIKVLEDQVTDAVAKGARILTGGKSAGANKGWFEPTILVDVDHTMKVMREESFGPIIGVQRVDNDQVAVELMNDTVYGLTASVYSKEETRARNILQMINSGTVYWNCCDRVSPYLPWSGRKHSGMGSTLSKLGIQAFVQPKAWHMKAR